MSNEDALKVENAILYIDVAGKKLGLPSNTISRAMILYHHFKRCVDTVKYEDGLSAAASISLAVKIDGEPVNSQSIVVVFLSMLRKKDPLLKLNSKEFQELQQSLAKVQFFFCRMLKFNLRHELAHQYLSFFLRSLHKREEFQQKWDIFVNISWKVVSSAYLTRRCLDYEASEIAVACLHIASKYCLINIDVLKNWQQSLTISLDNKKLNYVICDFLAVCNISTEMINIAASEKDNVESEPMDLC